MPYLIQRMLFRESPDRNGVDKFFQMDYMGAAEFEFGAIPKSLKAIRQELDLYFIHEIKLVVQGVAGTFFAVARASSVPEIRDLLIDQLGEKKTRLKELMELENTKFAGWFCIDCEADWAVFRTKTQATLWLKGLTDGVPGITTKGVTNV